MYTHEHPEAFYSRILSEKFNLNLTGPSRHMQGKSRVHLEGIHLANPSFVLDILTSDRSCSCVVVTVQMKDCLNAAHELFSYRMKLSMQAYEERTWLHARRRRRDSRLRAYHIYQTSFVIICVWVGVVG